MKIYHYTTLAAAVSIINKDNLIFRGTRFDALNDPMECVYANNVVEPVLKENQDLSEDITKFFPYIVSFSTKKDNPIMWRLYNSEICLEIDTDSFPCKEWEREENLSDTVSYGEVYYSVKEQMNEVIKKLLEAPKYKFDNDDSANLWFNVIPFIKHKDYEIEHEYRLVKMDYESFRMKYDENNPDKCIEEVCEIPEDVKIWDVKYGNLRFYKEFALPKKCLTGIIVHRFDDGNFQVVKKHLHLWLNTCKSYDIKEDNIIKTNNCPVR